MLCTIRSRKAKTSSTRQRTPSNITNKLLILFCNNFGALEMPKGSLLKLNLLYGVKKVVRSLDSAHRGIYQKPLLASSLVKYATPFIWAKIWSTLGIGWISLIMLVFKAFRSTQMHTDPMLVGQQASLCTIRWAHLPEILPLTSPF